MDLFSKIDTGVMKSVNAGVRAYNWTTGETKTQLANRLLCVAPICEVTGLLSFSYYFPITTLAVALMSANMVIKSHLDQKRNYRIERNENSARESSLLNIEAEHSKIMCKIGGYSWLGSSSLFSAIGIINNDNSSVIFNSGIVSGNAMRAIADFSMCADNLPPRKSFFRRSYEALEKRIAEYHPEPEKLPEPAGA